MQFKEDVTFQDNRSREGRFVRKWVSFILSEISHRIHLEHADIRPNPVPDNNRLISIRIARLLNLLNYPLFWGGIVLLSWLWFNPLLKLVMGPADYSRFILQFQKIENIVSPAVVGYWTNWLAIKMLFHPRHPNLVWQGLIPSKRHMIIDNIVSGISANLFSPQIVSAYIRDSGYLRRLSAALISTLNRTEFQSEFREIIQQRLRDFLNRRATQEAFRTALNELISQWKAETLLELPLEMSKKAWQPLIVEKLIAILPELPDSMDAFLIQFEAGLIQLAGSIDSRNERLEMAIIELMEAGFRAIHIEEIIRNQLIKMDEAQLEGLLTGNVSDELVFLQTSGGIFGLLVGLAISFPWVRWALLLSGLSLWIIYRNTVRKKDTSL